MHCSKGLDAVGAGEHETARDEIQAGIDEAEDFVKDEPDSELAKTMLSFGEHLLAVPSTRGSSPDGGGDACRVRDGWRHLRCRAFAVVLRASGGRPLTTQSGTPTSRCPSPGLPPALSAA